MKPNIKRLFILLRFVDVSIVLIILSIIFTFFYSLPYANKFSKFADNLPQSDKFDNLRSVFGLITYLSILKTALIRGIFIIVLIMIRRVLKSMITNGLFGDGLQNKIRKIAMFFLYLACLLMFFNFFYLLAAIGKGNVNLIMSALLNFIGIFERYVITALIGFSLVEVFIAGMRLKKENDLSI